MPAEAKPQLSYDQVLLDLLAAGFEVTRIEGGRARVKKGPCAAVLEPSTEIGFRFAERPGYLLGEFIARLEDRGYQKYLATPQRTVPALAEHLKAIHHFSEQLKEALNLTSLYNESLGTVSDRYLYDRLHGRESPRSPH